MDTESVKSYFSKMHAIIKHGWHTCGVVHDRMTSPGPFQQRRSCGVSGTPQRKDGKQWWPLLTVKIRFTEVICSQWSFDLPNVILYTINHSFCIVQSCDSYQIFESRVHCWLESTSLNIFNSIMKRLMRNPMQHTVKYSPGWYASKQIDLGSAREKKYIK